MPATSKSQQKSADAALAARRDHAPGSGHKGGSRDMAESMTEKGPEDLAATKHQDLPATTK